MKNIVEIEKISFVNCCRYLFLKGTFFEAMRTKSPILYFGFFSFITADVCFSAISLSTCFFSTFDGAIPIDRFTRSLSFYKVWQLVNIAPQPFLFEIPNILCLQGSNGTFSKRSFCTAERIILVYCYSFAKLAKFSLKLDIDRSKFCWDVLSGIYLTWQLDHLSQQQMSVASVIPLSSSVTRHLHRLVKNFTPSFGMAILST